ncbi:WD40-repeat-containing domain protein [Coniochaeta sp. 2T2.1]|nr:WD40-repeat-containing domain protein [Coniochaeta sp. 2T2.1]
MPALHYTHPKSLEGTAKNDIVAPTPDLSDTIQALRWSPVSNHLAVAAWDGRTRIYEVSMTDGQTRGVTVINAEGPLLSCDWSKDGSLVATAGADGKIYVLQASSGQAVSFTAHNSPIRDVRFVDDVPGCSAPIIALGSQPKPITWQCHRNPRSTTSNPVITDIYSVNAVAVHPTVKGCVATAGSDGSYRFWNAELSTHNRSYSDVGSPITACAFDCTGLWFAYAVGYDWAKGCYHNEASIPTRLVLHRVSKDDAK